MPTRTRNNGIPVVSLDLSSLSTVQLLKPNFSPCPTIFLHIASEFWRTAAQAALAAKLKEEKIVGQAKNVIMFLGDGWGVTTLTPARILKGKEVDKLPFGEEGVLHVDTFPHTGTSKV